MSDEKKIRLGSECGIEKSVTDKVSDKSTI